MWQIRGERDERKEHNIVIYKERLAELERDYKNGDIEQEHYLDLKSELQSVLLQDVNDSSVLQKTSAQGFSSNQALKYSLVCFLFVSCFSYGLYFHLGSSGQVASLLNATSSNDTQADSRALAQARQAAQQGDFSQLIGQLYDKLQSMPDNVEGWMLLVRSAMNMENYDLAIEGLNHLIFSC